MENGRHYENSQICWRFWFIIKWIYWSNFKRSKTKQKGGFLSMLLRTLGARFLGNMLAGKGINREGEGFITAVYGFKN